MQQLTQGLLNFLGIMHSHDLWLPLGCCGLMWKEGLKALRCYSFCAKKAKEKQKRLFCMRPKFHALAHTVWELKGSHERAQPFTLNPCIFNCEQNEDFIGRISRITRHVSPRLPIRRTLQRYGVAFVSRLRKMKKNRKN